MYCSDFHAKRYLLRKNAGLEYHYSEEVVVTPRKYLFKCKACEDFQASFALTGIASVKNGYPLYYDAINECGLYMAGLNFVGNAKFAEAKDGFYHIAQYELIPFILGRAKSVPEALELISKTRLINTPYDESTPVSELHYFLGDGNRSITLEPCETGFSVYENPYGVLTNNPPFPYHESNVSNYMMLTSEKAENRFSDKIPIRAYSRGMGAFGLPGDLSSSSRFIRAAFAAANAAPKKSEAEAVAQMFHILDFVSQTEGLVRTEQGAERTQYAVCANLHTGTYYYRTYDNSRITAVRLTEEAKDSSGLTRYPLKFQADILFEN